MGKNIFLHILVPALFISIAVSSPAQVQNRFDSEGRQRGYSRNIGGTTYNYDNQGREVGYSEDVGGQTIEYGPWGRQQGYSQTYGDRTYHYGKGGTEMGSTVEFGSTVAVPVSNEEPAAPAQTFSPSFNSNYWGFSDATTGQEQGKTVEQK